MWLVLLVCFVSDQIFFRFFAQESEANEQFLNVGRGAILYVTFQSLRATVVWRESLERERGEEMGGDEVCGRSCVQEKHVRRRKTGTRSKSRGPHEKKLPRTND